MIAIQDHGTNESSLETLPLFGAIKRRKFLKICCNLIDTNRPDEIATSLDAKKSDLGFLEQAMHWVLDCPKLDEFKQKLKDHDNSLGAV